VTRTKRPQRRFKLCGGNQAAYFDHSSQEYLLAGPAGTGKTLANLCKLLKFGGDHNGARMLIVRKTRVSLTETALVTWERDVLGEGHSILAKNLSRGHRHDYKLPNGSVLVTGGMDNPDKILSSEWDLIYVPEATDLDLVDWETLGGRLRANAGPYDQLFGDCNPTTPGHWLYKRCQSGKTKLYSTTHYENPRYYDAFARKWTEAGRRYIGGRLQQMTGHRRDRFLKGLWVAAEGLVYDGYNPELHLLPRDWVPPDSWPRLWSLDWGFNPSPIVLQFWALDAENRMHLYRETYRTRQMVADLGEWAKGEIEAGREPRPIATVSDHEEEKATVFGRVTGLHVTPAEKFDKLAGIQMVQEAFDINPADGRPRIFFHPDARRHKEDTQLVEAGKPLSTIEELTTYVWDTRNPDRPKDVPLDLNDHGMDAMLYARRWVVANLGRPADYDGPRGEDLLPGWMGEVTSATGW
jgi:phage terminase large subunit